MHTITKIALGLIGQLKPEAGSGIADPLIELPLPDLQSGMLLMQALKERQSSRVFMSEPLPVQILSDLLWSAVGINRPESGGHTAPSATHPNEMDVYAALPVGLYKYDPESHVLQLVSTNDVRRVTGYQDFVDQAPLDLIYVSDHARMKLVPSSQMALQSAMNVGAMAQNVSLYCASAGLAVVVRGWFDSDALSKAMNLTSDQKVILAQTIGFPKF